MELTLNFSSVPFSHSVVSKSVTPWTAVYHGLQAFLSIATSRSLLKLTSIELVMPCNHLILCHPLLLLPSVFPSISVFSNESVLRIRWKYWSSASASVLPVNIQDWFPLGLTGWVSLQSKKLSRVFSKLQFKSINSFVLSFLYGSTLTSIHDYWKNHSFD